jgi:hypothetical protein
MNSREKGKRGERQWRDELRANGYAARRGQQFSGSPDSPDVVCDSLAWIHFEVKAVERLNIEGAMEQARRDCRGKRGEGKEEKVPAVAHRRSFRPWLVTMEAETFFRLLRGDFTAEAEVRPPIAKYAEGTEGTQRTQGSAENSRFQISDLKSHAGPGARPASQISDFKGLSGPEKQQTTTRKEKLNESSS